MACQWIVAAVLLAASAISAAEPTYAEVYATAQRGGRMVVVISGQHCQPCERQWADLERMRQDGVPMVRLDIDSRQARAMARGGAVPQVLVFRRTAGVWHRQHWIGRRASSDVAAALEDSILAATADAIGQGVVAGHAVNVRGRFVGVEPDTLAAWRQHVGGYHGVPGVAAMSPSELAQAHADAHAR